MRGLKNFGAVGIRGGATFGGPGSEKGNLLLKSKFLFVYVENSKNKD